MKEIFKKWIKPSKKWHNVEKYEGKERKCTREKHKKEGKKERAEDQLKPKVTFIV